MSNEKQKPTRDDLIAKAKVKISRDYDYTALLERVMKDYNYTSDEVVTLPLIMEKYKLIDYKGETERIPLEKISGEVKLTSFDNFNKLSIHEQAVKNILYRILANSLKDFAIPETVELAIPKTKVKFTESEKHFCRMNSQSDDYLKNEMLLNNTQIANIREKAKAIIEKKGNFTDK